MSDQIIVQIASLPARVGGLQKAVTSLLPQVDALFVALNGYVEAPPFLQDNEKIEYWLMDNSLGASAKFYDVDKRDGYFLSCDDDIVYPSGYVRYMVDGVNRHGGIVTLLGKRYDRRPISSYCSGYTSIYKAWDGVVGDHVVHLGGTGVMCFHTDGFKLSIDDFPQRNMADLWVAKAAYEQGVSITVLEHVAGWLKHRAYRWRIWVNDKNNVFMAELYQI